MHAACDFAAVRALQQHRNAEYRFAPSIRSGRALPHLKTKAHRTQVAHEYRRAFGRGDHNGLDIFQAADQSDTADKLLLTAAFQIRAANVGVVLFQRVHHCAQRQTVADEF